MSISLVEYALTLPVSCKDETGYDLRCLVQDLVKRTTGNLSSNNTVIPILQTFNVLLEADALESLYEDEEGLKW